MNFFVAKFQTVGNSEAFTADKNGKLPVIGTVVAGIATASIINGTIFDREGLEQNKLYLCENYRDEEYPDYPQTRVISQVSAVELLAFRKELGEGRLVRTAAQTDSAPVAEVATVDESEVVAD